LTQSVWRPCIIDLSEFGVNSGSITSLAIGFERAGDPGVESMVLVDDITLYRVAPEIPEAVEPSTEGLVAYYAMENNVQDSSGNGHHGTVLGAPSYVDGIDGYGKAMEFSADSNDCIDLGDDEAFNPAGSFSISVWAYIKNWSTNWGDVMVSKRGEDNIGWQLRRPTDGSICFTTRGVGVDDMNSDIDAPLFEWVHIVCVYDNVENTKRIYVDGLLDSEVDTDEGETIAAATQNAYIGARALSGNDGEDSYFTGILDEVRIYDRALSYGEAVFLADPTP
jgi:MSHA biogenesis protein MshQ